MEFTGIGTEARVVFDDMLEMNAVICIVKAMDSCSRDTDSVPLDRSDQFAVTVENLEKVLSNLMYFAERGAVGSRVKIGGSDMAVVKEATEMHGATPELLDAHLSEDEQQQVQMYFPHK